MSAKGFMGGFLVLGFAIFLIGLLTGMLAIEILQVESDFSMLWFMVFFVGFLSGAVVSAMVLIIIRLMRSPRKPS
jgi:hypothetical protein